jgi:hypothetical protein
MSERTGFESWLDGLDAPARTVCTVNRTQPEPVQSLLEETFVDQPVSVAERSLPAAGTDLVVVIEDGEVVASTALDDLLDAFLQLNSDSFVTGSRGLDAETPPVLTALDGTEFVVRGYPASNKEKLLLTVISRHVERLALTVGDGTIRTLFQTLSRIDDERGTREVYERLAATSLDVHLYGRAGWAPPPEMDVQIHEGESAPYRDSWCVVFRPPPGQRGHAALVAVRTGEGVWRGAWTYDRERVEDLDAYVAGL